MESFLIFPMFRNSSLTVCITVECQSTCQPLGWVSCTASSSQGTCWGKEAISLNRTTATRLSSPSSQVRSSHILLKNMLSHTLFLMRECMYELQFLCAFHIFSPSIVYSFQNRFWHDVRLWQNVTNIKSHSLEEVLQRSDNIVNDLQYSITMCSISMRL